MTFCQGREKEIEVRKEPKGSSRGIVWPTRTRSRQEPGNDPPPSRTKMYRIEKLPETGVDFVETSSIGTEDGKVGVGN